MHFKPEAETQLQALSPKRKYCENDTEWQTGGKQRNTNHTHTPPTKKPKPKEQNNNNEKHQTKQTNQKHTTHKTISTGQLLKENIHKSNKFAARLKLIIASGHFFT